MKKPTTKLKSGLKQPEISDFQNRITELELSNHKLRRLLNENDKQFRAILDSIENLLWVLNESGTIVWANKAVYNRLGYSEQDIIGQSILKVHPPSYWDDAKRILSEILIGKVEKCKLPLLSRDGRHIPGITCVVAGRWNGNNIIVEVAEDLSEITAAEKKYQTALRESEERLELFFSQSLDGFFFMMLDEPIRWDDGVDKDKTLDYVFAHQRMTKVNDAMLAQYHATREQFIGLTPNDLFAHDPEQGRQAWRRLFNEGHLHIDTNERNFEGTPMWVEGDYVCMYDSEERITGHFGIQRDITARKQLEKALLLNEARLHSLFNQSNDAAFLLDFDGRHLAANQRAADMLGYSLDELMSLSVNETSAEAERSVNIIKRLMDGEAIPTYERRFRKKDGTVFPVEINVEAVYDTNGTFTHMQSMVRDISERKRVEEALRDSEARWQFALEGAGDGIWDYNLQTNETYFSRQWKAMLGYDNDEISSLQNEWQSRIHPDDAQNVLTEMDNHIKGKTPIYTCEYRIRCKNGEYKWILARGKVIQWTENKLPLRVIGTHTDITERKRREQQIFKYVREIEKLQAELHEQAIRDPLTGLYNRRHMQVEFRREFSRTVRENGTLSVIMIDLDELKEFNDAHGHHIGDLALQTLAQHLSSTIRLEDIACRYGGDEFVVLMGGTCTENASKRVEKWHNDLNDLISIDGKKLAIRFTAGIACYPSHGETLEDIINNADAALYRGKAQGGNCTVIFE